jgi:hypothetical protein
VRVKAIASTRATARATAIAAEQGPDKMLPRKKKKRKAVDMEDGAGSSSVCKKKTCSFCFLARNESNEDNKNVKCGAESLSDCLSDCN